MPHIDLIQIYNNISDNERSFLLNMRDCKAVYIGWVINYRSSLSNWIKFFTQSVFSHTNFFSPKDYNTIWAEELESVTLKNYQSWEYWEFYYVSKKLNLDSLALIYSFKYIESVLIKLWKFDISMKWKLQEKFAKYCYIIYNNPNISLKELLDVDYSKIYPDKSFYDKIDAFLEDKSLLKNLKISEIKNFDSFNNNLNNLKNFIILWIIKHILMSLNKLYDIKGTLTTSLSPWKSIKLSWKEYFCSEFVSETLLYAWVYPFDIDTKDPQSITPWDIMDSNILFVWNESTFYRFYDKLHEWELVEEIPSNHFVFFKNYIINKEQWNFYFIKKKLTIEIWDKIMKLIANSIRNSYIEKNAYISFKPIVRGLVSLWILVSIWLGYIFIYTNTSSFADIHNEATIQSIFKTNYLLKLMIIFIHFSLGIIVFVTLIYFIIFYFIPIIQLIKQVLSRLIFGIKE